MHGNPDPGRLGPIAGVMSCRDVFVALRRPVALSPLALLAGGLAGG
jgi:hypothetical protein